MLTDGIINALHFFILGFINDDKYINLGLKAYKHQLDSSFNGIVETIIRDIKRDADWLSKEANQDLKEGFSNLIPHIKDHQNALIEKLNKTGSDNIDDPIIKLQIDFCKKLQAFIETLPFKVEELNGDALSAEEISRCHFDTLAPEVNVRRLMQIYDNLINNGYINRIYTSSEDFIFYFTGDGLTPSEPIHWKSSIAKLTLFLGEVVMDEHIWAKAAHIFMVKNNHVGKKVLGNTHSKTIGRPIALKHLREIKDKIMRPFEEDSIFGR